MTVEQIRKAVESKQYDFLRTNPHLGNHIVLLGLSGSHAYGTNIETSDVDIRGIAGNTREEILTYHDFEQVEDRPTDTVVFSVNKFISLASAGNPLFIEMLGLKPEHYIIKTPIGEKLIANRNLFLSKRIAVTFGGYANQQLRRLDNKAARTVPQPEQEEHIMNSMIHGGEIPNGFRLHIEPSSNPDMEKEIFMDVDVKNMPLREYLAGLNYLQNVLRAYQKLGGRNQNAAEHGKLSKHMMHLVRLYFTGIEILETGNIRTYRDQEHDLLMEIRNGRFLDEEDHPTPEFREFVDDLSQRFTEAKNKSMLPDQADMDAITKLRIEINAEIMDAH